MSEPIMQINNLKTYFEIGKKNGQPQFVKAVDDVTLDIAEGEVLGLVGESGSGKSTIAYTIIGMYAATAGEITFDGKKLPPRLKDRELALKRDLQIVFQDPGSSLNKFHSIKEILELPLKVHHICPDEHSRVQRITELLEMVELPSRYMYKTPLSIGYGERQMVAIARALACDPRFIILDEPTSALDVSIQAKIINKLLELQKQKNLTYLFITHDLSLMRNIATRVAILYLGKVAEVAPAGEFFRTPVHPYTQMLLSSIPVTSAAEEALKPKKVEVRGEIPSPVNIPPGCSFHMRCPICKDICAEQDPVSVDISGDHSVRCHEYISNMLELGMTPPAAAAPTETGE